MALPFSCGTPMPTARINGINLYYEEHGSSSAVPLVFVHEFAGDCRSWEPQVRWFARNYRVVTYNARGYPPSEVPPDGAYSQELAVADLHGVLDHLRIERAHIVGFSMGGNCALFFGLKHPGRCRSLVLAGVGYGSVPDRSDWERDTERTARRFEQEGMAGMGPIYARGPTRVQFGDNDPRGFAEFTQQFLASSAEGHARSMRGIMRRRPSVLTLDAELRQMRVPTLIITGDEDEPCLEPGLFMKRKIPSAGLVMMPKCGHTINLEDPDGFNRHVGDFVSRVDASRWPMRHPGSVSASPFLPPAEAGGAQAAAAQAGGGKSSVGAALDVSSVRLHRDGSGPTVVLLHCLGVDHRLWDFTVQRLKGSFTLLRYDFPGHGESPVPPGPYTVEQLSAQLEGVLQRIGVASAAVVGISLGGLVAQHFAATQPAKVRQLVLTDTTPQYTDELRAMWAQRAATARAQGASALLEGVLKIWLTDEFRAAHPEAVRYVREGFARTPGEGYALACEALAAAALRPLAATIKSPTLVICGDQDIPSFQEAARWLAATIPQARLEWLRPAKHASVLEQPEAFARLLEGFLR